MDNKPDILLIYQGIPEDIQVYLIPGNYEHADTILKCHTYYINRDEGESQEIQDALEGLNDILYNKDEKNDLSQYVIYNDNNTTQLSERKILTDVTTSGELNVVVTGFIL